MMANPSCNGPVDYLDRTALEMDIANLKASAGDAEAFMTAASPGVIEFFMPNRYYSSTEEYLFALADAMKQEYDAICQAGRFSRSTAQTWLVHGQSARNGPWRTSVRRSPSVLRLSTTRRAISRLTGSGSTCAGATTKGRTIPTSRWLTSST